MMQINHLIAHRLYEEGRTDKEIAQRLGTNSSAVLRWRRAQELPSQRQRKTAETAEPGESVEAVEKVETERMIGDAFEETFGVRPSAFTGSAVPTPTYTPMMVSELIRAIETADDDAILNVRGSGRIIGMIVSTLWDGNGHKETTATIIAGRGEALDEQNV